VVERDGLRPADEPGRRRVVERRLELDQLVWLVWRRLDELDELDELKKLDELERRLDGDGRDLGRADDVRDERGARIELERDHRLDRRV